MKAMVISKNKLSLIYVKMLQNNKHDTSQVSFRNCLNCNRKDDMESLNNCCKVVVLSMWRRCCQVAELVTRSCCKAVEVSRCRGCCESLGSSIQRFCKMAGLSTGRCCKVVGLSTHWCWCKLVEV